METRKSAVSRPTPPAEGEFKPDMDAGHADAGRRMFVSAALSMSWQLAVVVLAPILGGYWLDQHFHMLPLGTIVGFVLAMGGVIMVLRRQLQELGPQGSFNVKSKRR